MTHVEKKLSKIDPLVGFHNRKKFIDPIADNTLSSREWICIGRVENFSFFLVNLTKVSQVKMCK